MSAVTTIAIGRNSFEGTLPESGLQERCPTGRLHGSKCYMLAAMTLKRQESTRPILVNLNRCNTLITGCMAGRPRPQPVWRANSTALAWRQRAGLKTRDSQSLRVSHMSRSCEHHGKVLEIILSRGLISEVVDSKIIAPMLGLVSDSDKV
eukprot:6481756-Amphidinium_carterae.1